MPQKKKGHRSSQSGVVASSCAAGCAVPSGSTHSTSVPVATHASSSSRCAAASRVALLSGGAARATHRLRSGGWGCSRGGAKLGAAARAVRLAGALAAWGVRRGALHAPAAGGAHARARMCAMWCVTSEKQA